jgi:hypothetical protein
MEDFLGFAVDNVDNRLMVNMRSNLNGNDKNIFKRVLDPTSAAGLLTALRDAGYGVDPAANALSKGMREEVHRGFASLFQFFNNPLYDDAF